MTLGEKIPLFCSSDKLESLLPNAPFALIKVPELTSGNHLLKIGGCWFGVTKNRRKMSAQSSFKLVGLPRLHRAENGVCAQIGDFAPNITDGSVHGVRECLTHIAAYDQRPFLRHERRHVAAVA